MDMNLEHSRYVNGVLEVEFVASSAVSSSCFANSSHKILHCIHITRLWGIRLKEISVDYCVDTPGVGICADDGMEKCAVCGQVHRVLISSAPQPYWKGTQKEAKIRVCIAEVFGASDFNVSYQIKAEPISQMGPFGSITDEDTNIESNMYVRT